MALFSPALLKKLNDNLGIKVANEFVNILEADLGGSASYDTISEETPGAGVTIDSWKLIDGGAGVLTGGTNTFNITNGTAVFDVAAGATLNIDQNFTVDLAITGILDEDNMATDSATHLATQQSIKAYVDTQILTIDTFAEILANGNTSGGTNLILSNDDGIVIGHTAQIAFGEITAETQILGTSETDSTLAIGLWSATDDLSPIIKFMKSGSAAIAVGNFVTVGDNEELGKIQAYGADGTDLDTLVAEIAFNVDDGSIATGQIGGEIILKTARSNGTLAPAITINNSQDVTFSADVFLPDNAGLVVGNSTQLAFGEVTAEMQILGTSETDSTLAIGLFNTTNALSPILKFMKSGNAAVGANFDTVENNEELGKVQAYGADGTDLDTLVAEIAFNVDDSSIAGGQIGGEMLFKTATSGGTLTTALTLSSTQQATFSGGIELIPSATGSQQIVDITPSATLAAGSVWKGINIDSTALDPLTGAASTIHALYADFSGVLSADGDDAQARGTYILLPTGDTASSYAHIHALNEMTVAGTHTGFASLGASLALSATATYRGLWIDWDSITRDANAPVLEGVRVELPADYTSFGTSYAGYFSGGGENITFCDGTNAITAVGSSVLPSIDMTPATDIDVINITGTNITSAAVMDVDLAAYVGGSVFDIDLLTSVLTASTIIWDTVISTHHDGLGIDTLVGSEISWSGNVPNGTADSSMRLVGAIYSGTWGSGGGEGGSLSGINVNFTGATINGSAVDVYGIYVSTAGLTRTSANSIYGIYSLVDSTDDAAIFASDGTQTVALADGTNAITISGGVGVSTNVVLQTVEVTLTATEITGTDAGDLGHTAGAVLVAAVAGETHEFVSAVLIYDYDTDTYGAGADDLVVRQGTTTVSAAIAAADLLGDGSDDIAYVNALSAADIKFTANSTINLKSTAWTQPGTAAGVLRVHVTYKIHTTGL